MNCLLCASNRIETLLTPEDSRTYFACGNCEFVWLDPRLRMGFSEEKRRYLLHDNRLENPEYIAYLRVLAEMILPYVPTGGKGVDYGCGPVEGMRHILHPLGYGVDSYDPIFHPKVSLPKNGYDFLLCNEAAEHFFDPLREFRTMDECLKRGGILGCSSRLLPEPGKFSRWYYRKDPSHVSFYSAATVRFLADRFSWKILRLESPCWLLKKN